MIELLRSVEFADLELLWVLVPTFLLWAIGWLLLTRVKGKRSPGLLYSDVSRLGALVGGPRSTARTVTRYLRWLVLLLLLLAVLRPQTGRHLTQVESQGIDIVLVVDTSGSMQALDLDTAEPNVSRRRNRLEIAKQVIGTFVEERSNDQLGLVVFGEQAFTQCPLTLDHNVLQELLGKVEIGMAGDATAIGSAVGVAVKRLQSSPAESKVIVLLTDGRSNAGIIAPSTAAEIAQTMGVKIYAVGVGSRGEAPFVVETPLGPQVVYENVEIDEEILEEMSTRTGGAYFRAEDEQALGKIYEQIDQLEKTEITTDSYVEYDDRFAWFVVPALIALLLEVGLLYGPLRRLP